MDFNEVKDKVLQGGSELVELKAAIRQLETRLDRNTLVIQALKDLLLSQGGFREEDFADHLQRAAAQKAADKTCRKCGKPLNPKQNRCLYCGEQRPPELL